jgi:hypothetical protein
LDKNIDQQQFKQRERFSDRKCNYGSELRWLNVCYGSFCWRDGLLQGQLLFWEPQSSWCWTVMRWVTTAAATLVILAAVPTPSGAVWFRRTGPVVVVGSCAYPGDNGCAGANQNGSFKNTGLLTSAQQSGQNSLLSTHPMTFNIPAVDYPIGPDKTLSPQDPRTISDGVCAWNGTYVGCTGSGTVNEVLNNYDFSGALIGKAAVGLYIGGGGVNLGSTFTVTNSYFEDLGSGTPFGFSGNYNFIIKNNQFDGTNATTSSDSPLRDDGQVFGTTLDIEYNAFINTGTMRVYNGGNSGVARTWKYNFIEGLGSTNTANHGEVDLMSCGASGGTNCANKTISEFRAEGNFVIGDTYTTTYCGSGGTGATSTNGKQGCVMSGLFFNSAGATHGIKYTAVNMINNVTVTNAADGVPSGSHIWGESLLANGWASVGTYTVTGNWTDATGAAFCTVSGPANGSESVTASQSGTVITISATSSSYGNNPIEPGWQFWRGGVVVATITSMGTSGGNLGTVNVDTSATIGSDSNWTLVPGFGTATLTNNWNLADPSHVGTPTALGMVSPTFKPANCLGAHN